jgi:hypothetical protein
MTLIDNPRPLLPAGELTARGLLDTLADHPAKPLVFTYEGRDIKSGYHVTEVKTGRFTALDCGANPESWGETFIQLWDVDEAPRVHMPAGRFVAIIDKVAQLQPFDPDTKLTFEVSDGVQAMQLFHAEAVDADGERIIVSLGRRPASCKPRDRWLAEQSADASCCASPSTQPCCG